MGWIDKIKSVSSNMLEQAEKVGLREAEQSSVPQSADAPQGLSDRAPTSAAANVAPAVREPLPAVSEMVGSIGPSAASQLGDLLRLSCGTSVDIIGDGGNVLRESRHGVASQRPIEPNVTGGGQGTRDLSKEAIQMNKASKASIIGSDVVINGEVKSDGAVEIYGSFTGELTAVELLIGAGATVEGNVSGSRTLISGQLQGTVKAGTLVIKAGGEVLGDIAYESVTIEQGANFEGRSKRQSYQQESVPQIIREAPPALPARIDLNAEAE